MNSERPQTLTRPRSAADSSADRPASPFPAIEEASFTPLGWFAPAAGDGVPEAAPDRPARILILIGNAGAAMWRRFAAERDPAQDSLDAWTRCVVGALARRLGAHAVYPFDAPPWPFLDWARRAGSAFPSPLGMSIHPVYGLWHAYRAALLFGERLDLPAPRPTAHPCPSCETRPCLSACPVHAFDGARYDVDGCARHLSHAAGADCMTGGCLARRACPVGREYVYQPAQAAFHMHAFRRARVVAVAQSGATDRA